MKRFLTSRPLTNSVYKRSLSKSTPISLPTFTCKASEENHWNDRIKGHWKAVLKTDKKLRKDQNIFDGWYNRVTSIEDIGNYSVWDFARYEVRSSKVGIVFLIFEINENGKAEEFVFNTFCALSPLFIKRYEMRNIPVGTF